MLTGVLNKRRALPRPAPPCFRFAHNVTLGMSGWMMGPPDQPAYWDGVLPADIAMSSLNPSVGWDPVQPAWANVTTPRRRATWVEKESCCPSSNVAAAAVLTLDGGVP